ncbi:hypothetical protein AYI69_g445, partial [Smittium culicis]
ELYWESPGYVSCPTSGSPNAETTLGTKEQCLVIDENVEINGETYRACQTEPFVLEGTTSSLERPIVPPGDPRTGTVYRCQRHRLGDSCGLTILLRIVESFGGVDAHQRQRTINDIIRTPAPECCWSFGIGLLRQYHHSSVCKEVWWDDFPETARNCRRNMEPLPSDEHTPSGHIRSVCNESSGCTESTNRADGMVNVRPSVLQNNGIIRTTRCRPVCIENKHQASKILQLVSRQQGCRSELPALQLVRLDQPILLPPVEPNFPGSPESAQRTSENHFNHTAMKNSNVVSGSTGIISCPAIASTGNDGHTRPQKRKISAVEQQKLVPYGMENQRRILQAQGLSDIAIDIIVSNQRAIKRRSRAIDETEIKSFVCPEIDISPILFKINEWGDTSKLDNNKLTTKCCWLLSLCGFLRASDIHRIDDARTIITNGTLKLVIIAPKEKRNGQPIERPCEINSHPNPRLCPVLAYTIYKAKIATELCPTPRANNDSITVNRLFRHTKHYNKPLSVDIISRHVKNLSGLIKRPPNTPIPKTRAIGATLTATSGVPVENIVSHAFWSNYSMFDTYYRLDRSTQSNMTEAVLPLE